MTLMQVIILLLFGGASIVYGQSDSYNPESVLVGPAYCAKGQIFWCYNFTTAIECNAVKHCRQAVWLTQKPPTIDGSCGSCETEIQRIREGVASNTTKEVIQELLENVCRLTYVTEIFRKTCEKAIDRYVDGYFNELLDLIKSDINPATVCHILGYCSDVEFCGFSFEDNTVVRFDNIVLHLPDNFIDITESKKLLDGVPSYWCHDIISSKQCKSTSHCIHAVWSKAQYNEDNDSVCKICKDMVQQARDQLQSNETQEELREVFEGSCKLIPIKEVRKECMKLADEFVPELTEMLVSEMNPTAICTIAGLCNSARIDNLLKISSDNAFMYADTYFNCTAALTAVELYLQRAPQSRILGQLLRLCDLLSTYSSACAKTVTSNFDEIYETLTSEIRPYPGICPERNHTHSSIENAALKSGIETLLIAANDDLPCDLCKQLVKHFKDVLTTNTTETEFKEILYGICQHFHSFKKDCLAIVDDNFQKIYKFLTEEMNPEEICREVNLCPKKNLVSDENMNLIYSRLSLPAYDIQLTLPSKKTDAEVECRLCKMIIQVIQREMNKPEYEHNIEKLLAEVCSLAPHVERNECNHFVQKYTNTLIEILATQTDPGIVCQLLELCPRELTSRSNEICLFCQRILHYIQEELEKPEEQQHVEDVVRKICKYVPKSEQKQCESFIADYASLIISLLSEELDPTLVCPALKLCPRQLSPLDRCIQCQYSFSGLITGLGSDRSEQNVKNVLSTFVSVVPSNFTLTAAELKVNHHEDIIDMMGAEFDAQESCVFLHYCDAAMISSTVGVVYDVEETNGISKPTVAKPTCELCELFVQLYVEKLTSNTTEKEIEDDLLKFCSKIKNPDFHSNCTHFVQEYVPQLAELVKKDVSPHEVCSLINLCPQQLANGVNADESSHCEFCEAVVGSLEGLMSDPEMKSESVASLIKLCSVFSQSKDRATCMKIISLIGPQVESVALGIPSWYYCSKIHMCPYGAHISYKEVKCHDHSEWCVDIKRAVLCDKLSYCKHTVWKSDEPSL